MNIEGISEIRIENNHIFVKPNRQSFEFIWRDASGVHWDPNHKALFNKEMKKLNHVDWFLQIIYSILSEYNYFLLITKKTKWINVSNDIKKMIIQSNHEKNIIYYKFSVRNKMSCFLKRRLKLFC